MRLTLVGILLIAATFRVGGRDWDRGAAQHPDERFFAGMATELSQLPRGVGYFDTERSTLNPKNHRGAFYVYGTLPLFATRWLNEWRTGRNELTAMTSSGRFLSTLADLGTVTMTFLCGRLLFGAAVGLAAAALYALAPLSIQLSHYFPVDTFVTFFVALAFFFACRIAMLEKGARLRRLVGESLCFALAAGCAASSKISGTAVLGLYLPAIWLYWQRRRPGLALENAGLAVHCAIAMGAVAFFVFRVLQPYAFSGPGFFDIVWSDRWLGDMKQQLEMSSRPGGYPPTVQWVDRSRLFAWWNLVRWGFGPVAGLLGWLGTGWLIRNAWRAKDAKPKASRQLSPAALIAVWTIAYFLISGVLPRVPIQRYQLPIYFTLALAAAWAGAEARRLARDARQRRYVEIGAAAVLAISLLGALAFTAIYRRPMTRLAATEWLARNAPGPINLMVDGIRGQLQVPIPFPYSRLLGRDTPYAHAFRSPTEGTLRAIRLAHLMPPGATRKVTLRAALRDLGDNELPPAIAEITIPVPRDLSVDIPFPTPFLLVRDREYMLDLSVATPHAAVFHLEGARIARETGWDDPLPIRWDGVPDLGGWDPFGGIYPNDLSLEVYQPETRSKLLRMTQVLERAEWLPISSQRQWGSIARLPERYPMTARFYQLLLGCPTLDSVIACYRHPESFELKPRLGFRLRESFRSEPGLFGIRFSDIAAEESLSVYDHPPVMILEKKEPLTAAEMKALLEPYLPEGNP